MLPDEERFCTIKIIGFEDCIMTKIIIMRGTVCQISNINKMLYVLKQSHELRNYATIQNHMSHNKKVRGLLGPSKEYCY